MCQKLKKRKIKNGGAKFVKFGLKVKIHNHNKLKIVKSLNSQIIPQSIKLNLLTIIDTHKLHSQNPKLKVFKSFKKSIIQNQLRPVIMSDWYCSSSYFITLNQNRFEITLILSF